MELTPDLRRREHDAPADPRAAEWAAWGEAGSKGKRSRAASLALFATRSERLSEPPGGDARLDRNLALLGASLAAHLCLLLALVLLSPQAPDAERSTETPVEVVVDQPPAAHEPEQKKPQQGVPPAPKAAEQKAAEQKAAEQKAAEQKAAEQKTVEQKAAEQKAAEQKAAEQKAAEQKAAEQKAAEQKVAEQKAAEQKAAEQKAAEQKAAEQKAAEQKAAEQKVAEQKAAEQKAAEQKAAEQKAAEQKAAEQKAATQKAAERKPPPAESATSKANARAASQKAQARSASGKPVDKFDQDFAGGADSPFGPGGGLRLPFDNGPEIFKAVAVPLPTEGGDELMSYKRIVFGLLARVKHYPESARERGAHGAAVISFTIDDAGELTNVSLLRSSGDTDLDVESLALVARAAPFPKPPPDAQRAFAAEITFGVEVDEDDK
jgi:TonB family protein